MDEGKEVLSAMAEDREVMEKVGSTLGEVGNELGKSNSILNTFKRKDCIDRIWIGAAVCVYAVVVLWVLYRR